MNFTCVTPNDFANWHHDHHVNERVEILLLGHHIAKNILQHQEVVESLAELWEAIRIPSSVMTFAVIHSLVSMRLQNFSINWGKGCSPDHGSFPVAEYKCLWTRVSCVEAGGFCWPIIFSYM